MLISSVLSILGNRDAAPRIAAPAESFAAILSSGKAIQDRPSSVPEFLQDGMAGRVNVHPLQTKDRAAIFSVERHSYDSFLRALEKSRKPLGAHALDLFQ